MKYLFGLVNVKITVIETENQVEAEKLFKCPPENLKKEDGRKMERATFVMPWNEYPGDNPVAKRDDVLASFLQLMQEQIPFTPDAKPSPIVQIPSPSPSPSDGTH